MAPIGQIGDDGETIILPVESLRSVAPDGKTVVLISTDEGFEISGLEPTDEKTEYVKGQAFESKTGKIYKGVEKA